MNSRRFFIHNKWWGKIIGAFFGYLMAGPAGALFGILIGNFFDRGLAQHFSQPYWDYYSEKRKTIQKTFFDATFSIMGHIAKADGRVSEREIAMAKTLMKEMRLNYSQEVNAQNCFNAGKKTDFNLYQTLNQLKIELHDNAELLKLFIDIQYRAAQVDGLTYKKQQVINTILNHFGFAPLYRQYRFYEDFGNYSTHQQTHQQHSSSKSGRHQQHHQTSQGRLEQAYAILEVSPSASKQEVKQTYRRLMSQNHPDKLIAKGLPETMIKMANEKTQAISKAYEEICKTKGW